MRSFLFCHSEREKDYATDLLLSGVHGRAEIIFTSFQNCVYALSHYLLKKQVFRPWHHLKKSVYQQTSDYVDALQGQFLTQSGLLTGKIMLWLTKPCVLENNCFHLGYIIISHFHCQPNCERLAGARYGSGRVSKTLRLPCLPLWRRPDKDTKILITTTFVWTGLAQWTFSFDNVSSEKTKLKEKSVCALSKWANLAFNCLMQTDYRLSACLS